MQRNRGLTLALLCGCLSALQTVAAQSVFPGDVTASVLLPNQQGAVSAELFVPPGLRQVRGIIVFVPLALDEYPYDNRDWRLMCARIGCAMLRLHFPRENMSLSNIENLRRDASAGGGQALLLLLEQLATKTAHRDLARAPVLLWGMSAASQFGITFAASYPDRTIGVIRYNPGAAKVSVDWTHLAGIPILFLPNAGGQRQGGEGVRSIHRQGRSLDAPWTFIVHPGPHNSLEQLVAASPLQRNWIEGVFEQRVRAASSTDKSTAPIVLRQISVDSGWLADETTGGFSRAAAPTGDRALATWLPTQAAALSWMYMRGACAALSVNAASRILGVGARVVTDGGWACAYGPLGGSDTTLRLIVEFSSARNESRTGGIDDRAVRQGFEEGRVRAKGTVQSGLGDAAYAAVDTEGVQGIALGIDRAPGCSVMTILKSSAIIEASLCGSHSGTTTDFRLLRDLARVLLKGLQE